MSLSALTVMEVRTAGNDANGGGFVAGASGTDFSQQNAAQYTFADLASANGNAAAPVVSSASHAFVAADVGNIMQITAGTSWTPGFYQIVSVAGGNATMDRAVGTVAGLAGGTYAVGGALATPQKALSATAFAATPFADKGAVIYVKQGTYTFTVALDTGNGANQQQPNVSMVGYDVARGDNTGTKPLFTTSTLTGILVKIFQNTQTQSNVFAFDNINFSSTNVTPGVGITVYNISANTGGMVILSRCKLSGFGGTAAISDSSGVGGNTDFSLLLVNCEIGPNSGAGVSIGQNGGHVYETVGCYIHNNVGVGFSAANIHTHISTIFDSNTGIGVQVTSGFSATFMNCDITNNGSDGIANASSHFLHVQNCIIYGNGVVGLHANSCWVYGANNAFGNNLGGNGDSGFPFLVGTIALSVNPFMGGANFALNSLAGGGLALLAKGSPGPYGASTTSQPNVGAVQINVGRISAVAYWGS